MTDSLETKMTLQLTINRKYFWGDAHEHIMKLAAIAASAGEVTLKAIGDDIVISTAARAKARKAR